MSTEELRAYLLKPKPTWNLTLCDPRNNFGHSVLGPRPPQDVIDSYANCEFITLFPPHKIDVKPQAKKIGQVAVWRSNSTDPYNKLGNHIIFDPRRSKRIETCRVGRSLDFIKIVN